MIGINKLVTSILGNKTREIKNTPNYHTPIKTQQSCDTFEKSPVQITYETTDKGCKILKLVKTGNISTIKKMDGTTLYEYKKGLNIDTETVFSSNGKKLYEIEYNNDGSYIKSIFTEDGNTIKSIIEYDKDGFVKSKKIQTPEITKELSTEQKAEIPEYFYHITSLSNYESMTNEGFIRTTTDSNLNKEGNRAVFLLDGKNTMSKWTSIKNGKEISYITRLLNYCNKDKNGNLIILKIPTSKLDVNKLRFRDQNECLNGYPMFQLTRWEQEEYFGFEELYEKIHPNRRKQASKLSTDIFLTDRSKRLTNGEHISELLKKTSNPLEFMYLGNIPIETVQETKTIDTSKLSQMSYYKKSSEDYAIELIKDFFEN